MVDGRHVCTFSSWYLPVRYASSASVTWLVCSAREFTETTLWVILTEYFSSVPSSVVAVDTTCQTVSVLVSFPDHECAP